MFGTRGGSASKEASSNVATDAASSTAPTAKPKNKAPVFVKPWGPNVGRRHLQALKRWWWLYFLIVASIVLLITLPIIYVLYPKLSQQGIDNTTITVEGIGLAGPAADSYLFSLNTTLLPQTSYSVNLDAFNVSFYLTDYDLTTPFTSVVFPAIHVDHETTVNITQQRVAIQNVTAWEKYLSVAFTQQFYSVTTIGYTKLYLGALPKNNVVYNKTLVIPGYGGLTDISTTNLTVVLGDVIYDFYATADVQNPSPSTAVVGNITYDTYLAPNDTFIGQTFLTDVVLGPGANVFPFKSSTSQTPVVQVLETQPFCQTGTINVTIVPHNVTYGGDFVPWLLPILANVTQTLPIVGAIEAATHDTFKVSCPSS